MPAITAPSDSVSSDTSLPKYLLAADWAPKVLEPISEYENWENETVWSVIGSKKPKSIKKKETANEYKEMYYKLVDLYKNQDLPPKN